MRVLLIYPDVLHERVNREDVSVPPIGIFYVGALLRKNGHDAEILNGPDFRDRPGELEQFMEAWGPDLIGFSVLNANRWGAIDLARAARRRNPRVRIVFGGIGATFLWDMLLKTVPDLDYVVLGEGERTFLELVQILEKGDETGPGRIRGLGYLKDGNPHRTEDAPLLQDLDSLPDPAEYFTFSHVAATRGCSMNCAFCGSPRFWGQRVRAHSPVYFVNQLELLNRKGVGFFYFSDDTFTADRSRVVEISRLILEKGLQISWFAIARVDHVDEGMLRWMRRAGCIQISYGVESGSKRIRRRLNKPLRRETIKKAFAGTTRAGILPRAYFIYGCPGETEDSIRETRELIREIRPIAAIFYILELFPGTALYEEMRERGLVSDDVWKERMESIPYFEMDASMNADRVLEWGRELREGFYRDLSCFVQDLDFEESGQGAAELQADFLSRLAMTFSHGDYSRIHEIPSRERISETLFKKALKLFPDQRSYLGLSILKQKSGDHQGAVALLEEGLSHYPRSEQLSLCLGISRMNMGKFDEALEVFSTFPDSREAQFYSRECREVLGRDAKP